MELVALTVAELLGAHGAILEELRRREIMRSANNPVSDLAELLFCRAFKWKRENGSAAGYDARDRGGVRFQIKGRRFTLHNNRVSWAPSAICRTIHSTSLRVCCSTQTTRLFERRWFQLPLSKRRQSAMAAPIAGSSTCVTVYGANSGSRM
jgi:hypothetical protein